MGMSRFFIVLACTLGLGFASAPLVVSEEPKGKNNNTDPASQVPQKADASAESEEEDDLDAENAPAWENEFQDLVFDRYVDIHLVARAWKNLDAALLTDLALQLAEGERILHRPHKSAITSEKVFKLAAKAAAETKDKASLERLEKVAEAREDKELKTLVAAVRKTLGESRAADPAANVSVENVSAEQFAELRSTAREIKSLELAGDARGLEEMEKQLQESNRIDEGQKQYLLKLTAAARAAVGEKTDPLAVTLKKLAGESRGVKSNRKEVRARIEEDGWTVVWGININEAEYAKLTAAIATAVATDNPAPVKAYFDNYLERTIDKMQREVPGIGRDALTKAVLKALEERGRTFRVKRVGIKAGIATYQRWEKTVYDEPRTRKVKKKLPFGGWTWSVESYTERVEKKIPLPNHHQPYVAFRLY